MVTRCFGYRILPSGSHVTQCCVLLFNNAFFVSNPCFETRRRKKSLLEQIEGDKSELVPPTFQILQKERGRKRRGGEVNGEKDLAGVLRI